MVNKNSVTNSYIFLVFIIAVSFFYYLGSSFDFITPYGHDDVIGSWPIGNALSESSFQNFPKLLVASFLGEDHLFPIANFLSYLVYSSDFDPIITIGITTKAIYILILIATGYLVNFLYADRLKTTLALGLIISNQALVFVNQTSNILHNLSILFSIFGFYIVAKYIFTKKNKYLLLIWLIFLLGSFSFESFFLTYAVAVFFSLYQIFLLNEIKKNKVWICAKLFSILFLSLIPYFLIHYQLYGTILPSSRIDIAGENQQLITAALTGAKVLNEWLYGLPRYLFFNPYEAFIVFPILGLILFTIKKKVHLFYDRNTNALLFSSILSLFVIIYTGRHHPGMWAFSGIIFMIAFSDIIKRLVDNFNLSLRNKHFVFIALITFFVFFNFFTKPYGHLVSFQKDVNKTSNAAYDVLGSSVKNIIVVRLPNAPDFVHPVAFWIGNQIYHQFPGLSYFPDHNILKMKNMYIERYSNYDNKSFSFFENLLENYKGKSTVLFKDTNLFFTFPKKDLNNVIYHGSVFSKPIDGFYKVYIPKYFQKLSSDKQLNIDVVLDDFASKSYKLLYGGKLQSNFTISGNKLSFVTDDFSSPNKIIILNKNSGKPISLKDIKISSSSKFQIMTTKQTEKNNNALSFVTKFTPCSFNLQSSSPLDVRIYATLDKMTSLPINTLYPIYKLKPQAIATYKSFDITQNSNSISDIESTYYICK